jgi:Flp pilus assembly pilin Flp
MRETNIGCGGRHMIREFLLDEDGMGVVEVVLIIVVLVAIAAIFKKQIVALVNNIWTSINKDAKSVYS